MEWQTKKITLNFEDDDHQDSQFWAYWQDKQTQELFTTNGLSKVVIEHHGAPSLLEPYVDHQGQEWNSPDSPLKAFTRENGDSSGAFGLSIFTNNGIHHFLMNEDTIRGLVAAVVQVTNQPTPKGVGPYLSSINKVIEPLDTETAQPNSPTKLHTDRTDYNDEEWETYITGLCVDRWSHWLEVHINDQDLLARFRVPRCFLVPDNNGYRDESGQLLGYLSPSQCVKNGLSYRGAMYMDMFLEDKEAKAEKFQPIFFGDFPLRTPNGTLILDGIECYPKDSYYAFLANRINSVTWRASRIAGRRISKAMLSNNVSQEVPCSLLDTRTFRRLWAIMDVPTLQAHVDIVKEVE